MLDSLQVKKGQQTTTSHNNQQQQQFYPRIENLTDIKFTEEELKLLNNGLEYSIEKPLTTYFTSLAVETERAIKLLDTKLQNEYRNKAAKKLKEIFNASNHHNIPQAEQLRIAEQLKSKLVKQNAILVQADNGKTVIINSDKYSKKVHTFLEAKNFLVLPKDPTGEYQKFIRKTIQQCKLIIDKHEIKYLMQKKPSPPKLKAQLKLHESNIPIRPVINNMKAPTYNIAKRLDRILNEHLTLNNHYTVANSTNLAIDLTNLKIKENHKLVTYNIRDLYDNIPIEETLATMESTLLKNNNTPKTRQIITLTKLVLSQNYFTFQNKIYQTKKGVPLGSPISSTIAEIFLQHFVDKHIKQLSDMKNIIFYKRYADDILIIYDTQRIQPNRINTYINQIHKDIEFNHTYENNECAVPFMDILIIRKQSNLEIDIFRKPTTTDTTINFFSNHHIEHKFAAFRYDITRMHSLPLKPERKQKEWILIQQIAQNNNFPEELLQHLNYQIQHKENKQEERNKGNKSKTWTTFTYYSPIVTEITNLFEPTNVGISFTITNTLQHLTKSKIIKNTQEQDKSGIYKLTCKTCRKSYIGQTSRSIKQRCQEHFSDIKHNVPKSAFAKHIQNNNHECGTLNDTMTVLKHIKETTLLIPYEQLYTKLYHDNEQLIQEQRVNKHVCKDNPIYQLIHDLHIMSLPPD